MALLVDFVFKFRELIRCILLGHIGILVDGLESLQLSVHLLNLLLQAIQSSIIGQALLFKQNKNFYVNCYLCLIIKIMKFTANKWALI
jgi:hypothetical protein